MADHRIRKALAVAAISVAGMLASVAATPRQQLADAGTKVELERMVPASFDAWRIDETIVPVQPAADVSRKLEQLYDQILTRTYVNDRGQRVMLSIAYGRDQTGSMRAHYPEVCYGAQGFQISSLLRREVDMPDRRIPLTSMLATRGMRVEPVSYWITVGTDVVSTGLQHKLSQLRYGLGGYVADGLLVRVSTIGIDLETERRVQEDFLRQMLAAMPDAARARFLGLSVPSAS